MKRLIVGISGASGVIYGIRLLEMLKEIDEVETHLVMSRFARMNIEIETSHTPKEVESLADEVHKCWQPGCIDLQWLVQDRRHGDCSLFNENPVGHYSFIR